MDTQKLRASFLAVFAGVSWSVIDQRTGEQVQVGRLSQHEAVELSAMLTSMAHDSLRVDATLIVQGGYPVLWTGHKAVSKAS